METEKLHQLPFVDVTIQNSNNQLITSVYRKPTHTDQYIQHHSNHHPQIKRAIVSTLARRAKNICSPSNLQQELAHLKSTFINGYPRLLVETTTKKTLEHRDQPPTKPEPSPVCINIPYVGSISHHISRLLKKTASIDTTLSSGKTLKSFIKANDSTIDDGAIINFGTDK
ncbi:uncharacterized protein LOC124274614 [Haliotis rubra]|uniref:uncharacterized protein LOC124274614 n=1 Tax=Haliotis rubra TaxID=36100 RepID=UPI001EE62F9A|nr:uncharacterized protein LOC124274614 [Haliotis rubra]